MQGTESPFKGNLRKRGMYNNKKIDGSKTTSFGEKLEVMRKLTSEVGKPYTGVKVEQNFCEKHIITPKRIESTIQTFSKFHTLWDGIYFALIQQV